MIRSHLRRKTVQVNQFAVSCIVLIGIGLLGGEMIAHHLVGLVEEREPEVIRIERKISFTTVIKASMKDTPEPSVSPTMAQVEHTEAVSWSEFQSIAKEIARQEDYPYAVLIGQATIETGRGRSNFAMERFNYFGMAAYDSNPNAAHSYKSVEEGIRAYISLIKTAPRYQRAWSQKHNPKAMVAAIKAAGYATDPLYVEKVTGTPEFQGN